VAVTSAGPYASLHLSPDRQPRQQPTTLFFTGRVPFLPPNQQRQSTEGIEHSREHMVNAQWLAHSICQQCLQWNATGDSEGWGLHEEQCATGRPSLKS